MYICMDINVKKLIRAILNIELELNQQFETYVFIVCYRWCQYVNFSIAFKYLCYWTFHVKVCC